MERKYIWVITLAAVLVIVGLVISIGGPQLSPGQFANIKSTPAGNIGEDEPSAGAYPDLVVESVELYSQFCLTTCNFQLQARIKNYGGHTMYGTNNSNSSSYTRFSVTGPSGYIRSSAPYTDPLGPGETMIITESFSNGPFGDYVVNVQTDVFNAIMEINENNNARVRNFNLQQNAFTLNVTKIGTGSGTVTSSPSGINCGGDCGENYLSGTTVALTAVPSAGSFFARWSGACSHAGTSSTCNVVMNSSKIATANFTLVANQTADLTIMNITVNKVLGGNGTYNVTVGANVKNIGQTGSPSTKTNLEIIGFGLPPCNQVVTPALSPGQTVFVTGCGYYPVSPGNRTARAIADSFSQVVELSESNNILTTSFNVP